jgi:hypothetical protein
MKRLLIALTAMVVSGSAIAAPSAALPSRYLPKVPVGTPYNTAHFGLLGLGYFPAKKSACMAKQVGPCQAIYENNCNETFMLVMNDGHVVGAKGMAPLHAPRGKLCDPTDGHE